jgi:hypothetical protein
VKGLQKWKVFMAQEKVTLIGRLIAWLGTLVGRLLSGKPKLTESPPSGNRALGRLSDREIHKQMLLRIMRDLSDEYYASGWMIGLEHYLWNLALRQNTVEGQMLLRCAEISGWWIWDDKAGGHVFVPLAAWQSAYREDEMLEPA